MHETLPIPGPLRLGDLLDRAFRLYRARFWILLLTGAVLLVPLGVFSGVLTGRTVKGFLDAVGGLMGSAEAPPDQALDSLSRVLGYYGLQLSMAVLAFLVNGLVMLALTYQAIATLAGRRPSLVEGLRRGLGRFLAFVIMSIIQVLLIGVVTVIVLLPLILLLVAVAASGIMLFGSGSLGETGDLLGGIGTAIFLLCGYLAILVMLFLPALYLSARWIAAVPGLVAQRWGPVEALRRSWALTKGQVLRCAGYLILLWFLSFIVVTLPTMLIQQLLFAVMGLEAFDWATGVSSGLGTIGSVLWQPLAATAVVLLYYDLRVRKESYDLALRVERLEAEVGTGEEEEDRDQL